MKRRDFLKTVAASLGVALVLPWCRVATLKPTFATVDKETLGIILRDKRGPLANDWTGAQIIDLDTGKHLVFLGKEAQVVACDAAEGWAIVQDYDSPFGRSYLDKHGAVWKIKVLGRFEIREA